MPNHICPTCGVQYTQSQSPPDQCAICMDERQYVDPNGQRWTTRTQLTQTHKNVIREVEPRLTGIATEPTFAIGQRALLIQTPQGNILWDCISHIDDATVEAINKLGGIHAIAISHPHFYAAMVDWSHAFDHAPIHLHAADREWVMRPDPAIHFWEGESKRLNDEITLVRCGGHFAGSAVLHWSAGSVGKNAVGKGALLTGDTIMVVADRLCLPRKVLYHISKSGDGTKLFWGIVSQLYVLVPQPHPLRSRGHSPNYECSCPA